MSKSHVPKPYSDNEKVELTELLFFLENILENEQIRNSVLILNEFYKNGYLREASESTIISYLKRSLL